MTRRRPATAATLAALVLLAGGCAGDRARTGPPSTAPPAPASTTAAGPTAWVDSLPVGAPPALGYVIGHTYHSAEGRVVRLPQDRGVTWISRIGDGFLTVDDRFFEGTAGVDLLDGHGDRVRELGTIAGAPVLDADGPTLRWITFTPPEVSPPEREPTRLMVADVATGEILSRVVHRDPDRLPRVADRTAPAVLPRRALPGPWLHRSARATVAEDRDHVLVAIVRKERAAVLRADLRSGDWELAVDWTPTEETYYVAFETRR